MTAELLPTLQEIKEDLQGRHSSRKDILTAEVKSRLDKSLREYEKELSQSLEYLQVRNQLELAKKLNREEDDTNE